MYGKYISAAIIVLFVFGIIGCSAEKYGADLDRSIPVLKVKDIFLDQNIVGRKVALTGSISSQCGSNGCWFVLQDDSGQVFINLSPNNMSIPPRMNKKAKVTGTVHAVQGELQIIAEGVEVR